MRTFLFFLLIAWCAGSVYWYTCELDFNAENNCSCFNKKTTIAEPTIEKTPLLVKDGVRNVVRSEEHFRFGVSDAAPKMEKQTSTAMDKLVTYLKNNEEKRLNIMGYYHPTQEQYKGLANNLGKARAEELKKYLVGKGVAGSRIEAFGKADTDLQFSNEELYGGIDLRLSNVRKPVAKIVPRPSFVVMDGKDTIINTQEHFGFKKNDANPAIGPEVQKNLDNMSDYLDKNKGRELIVVGQYAADEKNASEHPDLGIARAEAVKKKMSKAPQDRVKTRSEMAELHLKDGAVIGGVRFDMNVTEEVQKNIKAEARTFFFDTGERSFDVDAEMEQYFKDVKTYLEQDKDAKVLLTGYADTVGLATTNMELSSGRAIFIKENLVRLQVDADRINTLAKGENTTYKTNARNRRVEMIMK